MNLVVSFLDGYYDSGARVADLDRITWDVDYLDGYRQRIADENEWAAESWMTDDSIEPAHSDHIFNADHRNRVDSFVCVTDDPTIGELMAMYEANAYGNEPGYTASWMTY
jgi:hypothetical protein